MKIGIDIDGVLTDMERFLLDHATKFCKENNLPINVKIDNYDERIAFGWTEEQTIKFWNQYLVNYATKYPFALFNIFLCFLRVILPVFTLAILFSPSLI